MLDQHTCIMRDRIGALETGQAETRVYVKQIKEDIQEIKDDLKKIPHQQFQQPKETHGKEWVPVVLELIKLITICVTILGAIVGAAKILEK